MPYFSTPPGSWKASNTVTSQPALAMSAAQAMPAGPEPTMPTLKPLGWMYGTFDQRSRIARSPTQRSSLPMATGSSVSPTVQEPSHCDSCGHTRPHTAGNRFVDVMTSYAPR